MTIAPNSSLPGLRRSHILRVVVLGVLLLVLQIPIFMIDGLIGERRARRDQVVDEIASRWGRQQVLTGPVLVVPYVRNWIETAPGGIPVEHHGRATATLLPEHVAIRGRLDAESRRRGIFSVPLYRETLDVEGEFANPDLSTLAVDPKDIDWSRARVVVGVSDTRAMQSSSSATWNGGAVELLPGTEEGGIESTGVHAAVVIPDGGRPLAFSFHLALQGSAGVYWVPMGRSTTVHMTSNWPSPSFQGNWLPNQHSETARGFIADWNISYLGRNFPQSWTGGGEPRLLKDARFGVDLIQTVDHYQVAARSVKYAGMFLLLTFLVVWIVDVLYGTQVHPIQYLFLGAALCVFYLLELSLSEHLGFGVAYLIATLAIVVQVAGYALTMLRSRGRAAIVAAMVAGLYAYLYVVLTNEDYALLIGSLGIFAILATVMYMTRRVNWYEPKVLEAPRP